MTNEQIISELTRLLHERDRYRDALVLIESMAPGKTAAEAKKIAVEALGK